MRPLLLFFLLPCLSPPQPLGAQQRVSLAIAPVAGLESQDTLRALWAGALAGQTLFRLVPHGDEYSDYVLESSVAPLGGKRILLASVKNSRSSEILSGGQRVFQVSDELVFLVPSLAGELMENLPPSPDSLRKPSASRGLVPTPPQVSEAPSLKRAFFFPIEGAGAEEQALFEPLAEAWLKQAQYSLLSHGDSRVQASLRENFLLPLPPFNHEVLAKLGRILNADMILYGTLEANLHSRSLELHLASPKNQAFRSAGPWAYASLAEWKAFAPLAVEELLGGAKQAAWAPLLPKYMATVNGRAVAALLGGKADSEGGDTPLMRAVLHGYADLTEILLQNKSSAAAANGQGWTPLHWAAAQGNEELLKLLLASNAPINAKNSDGWTPLTAAVIRGKAASVRLLLAAGADKTLPDKGGRTPLQWARSLNYTSIAELFQQKEALP